MNEVSGATVNTATERRSPARHDRRASRRGGRRNGDSQKPWWLRRRFWLLVVTSLWVWWRKVRTPRSPA